MGRTCDARKEAAFPGRMGGAGRAHAEGEWLGRMFLGGKARQMYVLVARGRGPGSGAPHLARGPLPAPSTRRQVRLQYMYRLRAFSDNYTGG